MILTGVIVAAAGALILVAGKFFPLGRLPGDIVFKRDDFSFYFPVVTCIIISIILTIILNLIFRR